MQTFADSSSTNYVRVATCVKLLRIIGCLLTNQFLGRSGFHASVIRNSQ